MQVKSENITVDLESTSRAQTSARAVKSNMVISPKYCFFCCCYFWSNFNHKPHTIENGVVKNLGFSFFCGAQGMIQIFLKNLIISSFIEALAT